MKMVDSISTSTTERSSNFNTSEKIISSASATFPVVLYYLCALITNLHLAREHQKVVKKTVTELSKHFATVESANLDTALAHTEQTLSNKNKIQQVDNFIQWLTLWPMYFREEYRLSQHPILSGDYMLPCPTTSPI